MGNYIFISHCEIIFHMQKFEHLSRKKGQNRHDYSVSRSKTSLGQTLHDLRVIISYATLCLKTLQFCINYLEILRKIEIPNFSSNTYLKIEIQSYLFLQQMVHNQSDVPFRPIIPYSRQLLHTRTLQARQKAPRFIIRPNSDRHRPQLLFGSMFHNPRLFVKLRLPPPPARLALFGGG